MAIWNSDGSVANIQALHDQAATHDLDTITIPSGTFHWSGAVTLTKAVILQGNTTTDKDAGTAVENTVIVDDYASASTLIRIGNGGFPIVHSAGGQRITGISFQPGTGTAKNGGVIEISDTSIAPNKPVRIDHCYFGDVNVVPNVVNCAYRNYGVIDHCVRHNTRQAGMLLCYWGRNTGDHGDPDFQTTAGFGGPNFFFVEDNWMQDATDISFGGKICFRHNHVHGNGQATSGHLVAHGPARSLSDMEGGRAYEAYNNDFHYPGVAGFSIDGWDSGTHCWHDNTYENGGVFMNDTNSMNYMRMAFNYGEPWEATNGNNWDVYATRSDGTHVDGESPFVFDTGTVTSGGQGFVTDTSKNWTGIDYTGYVVTRPSDGQASPVTSNTSNTLNVFSSGFNVGWANGQTYKILKVLKVIDGLGYGSGTPMNQAVPAYPNYALEPCYSWNNTNTDTGHNINFNSPAYMKYIWRQGIEFYNDTPMPGYTQYTYPHPLVSGGALGKIISLSGTGFAFGNVTVGSSGSGTLHVTNNGDQVLTVTSISYPAGFSGAVSGFTVAPTATTDVGVTFSPILAQAYSGNITVNSDATSGTNVIAVSGTGVPPVVGPGTHKKRVRDSYGTGM